MEKVIDLKSDRVFRHAEHYNDAVDYGKTTTTKAADCREIPMAELKIREAICNLVMQGKLNAVDLKIIRARDCSPMPSMRKVAILLKIDVANISRRSQHIKRLIAKAIS